MKSRLSSEQWARRLPKGSSEPGWQVPPLRSPAETIVRRPGQAATDEAGRAGALELFVPEHYEVNYAYPLLVWLTATAGPPRALERLMGQISERNYLAASLPVAEYDVLEAQVFQAVGKLRRRHHVHSERVYVAGFGAGGTAALQLALWRPEWFAGAVALSASLPSARRLLRHFEKLRGKPVLIGAGERDEPRVVADMTRARRLLGAAGLHVTALEEAPPGDPRGGALRQIDRWIMSDLRQVQPVC